MSKVVVGGGGLLLLSLAYLLITGGPRRSFTSIRGEYSAEVRNERDSRGEWIRIRIRSTETGEVLFVSDERWAARHHFQVAWDAENRVWVNSSDVGLTVYEPATSAGWLPIPTPQQYWLDLPPEVAAEMAALAEDWAQIQRLYPPPTATDSQLGGPAIR